MPSADARTLSATITIAAAPEATWRVVCDVRRTPEWSPECRRVIPLGSIRRGAWLLGINRRERVRWPALSRITSFDRGREIAWKVVTNGSIWTYYIAADKGGTTLSETRTTPSGVSAFARWFTRVFLGGQHDHDDELQAGMTAGLIRIKQLVEATTTIA